MSGDLEQIRDRLVAERQRPMARWQAAPTAEESKHRNIAELVEACFPTNWRLAHRLRQAQKQQ